MSHGAQAWAGKSSARLAGWRLGLAVISGARRGGHGQVGSSDLSLVRRRHRLILRHRRIEQSQRCAGHRRRREELRRASWR